MFIILPHICVILHIYGRDHKHVYVSYCTYMREIISTYVLYMHIYVSYCTYTRVIISTYMCHIAHICAALHVYVEKN